MDKFNNVLNKLGLRGSSEDDGHRSAQSTPRLSRSHRVRESNVHDNPRSYGSMGSMENYRVKVNQDWTRELGLGPSNRPPKKKKKSKSADTDRVPRLGLDRSWENERAKGMELLYQSVERQRERQRQRDGGAICAEPVSRESRHPSKSHGKKKRKDKDRHRSRSQSHDRLEHYLVDPPFGDPAVLIDPNFRLSQERLERRIDELNKQLLVEKHSSRRDKLTLARLQQEMSRQKSERQLRETLMRELERERMLRMDAEHRLCEVTGEHEASKSRLRSLQEEFEKMEEMVRSMLQYKGKLEALKSEKASLSINYEHSMQRLRTHVGNLEHENKILMAEIKKLESQCANCHLCNKDLICHVTKQSHSTQADCDSDKTKVLLERLKMLEAEKSALVLENEAQRQQYDKCLDQIANQVVQALMSQKTLREECNKLQKRVQDLETQNKQLSHMFMHRIKFASDSVLQSLACKRLGTATTMTTSTFSTSNSSTASLCAQTQVTFVNGGSPRPAQMLCDKDSSHGMGTFSEVSLESLQSICSDYNEQPQLSSPPAWLRDKVYLAGESPTSSVTSSGMTVDAQRSEITEHAQKKQLHLGTSDASSPGSDVLFDGTHHPVMSTTRMPPIGHTSSPCHVVGANGQVKMFEAHAPNRSVLEPSVIIRTVPKVLKSPAISPRRLQSQGDPSISSMRVETEFPADMTSPKVVHHAVDARPQVGSTASKSVQMSAPPGVNQGQSLSTKQDDILRALTALTGKTQGFQNNICTKKSMPSSKSNDVSPAQELLGLSDAFPEKFTIHDRDGLPRIQNNLYDDSDSDDSYGTSHLTSKDFSATSTISLNELLDQGLDDVETPNDDTFSIDDFHCGDTDDEKAEVTEGHSQGAHVFGALIKAGHAVLGSDSGAVLSEEGTSKISSSSQTSPGLEHSMCECDQEDSVNLGDETPDKTNGRKEVILNNCSSVVMCKPPLPRPLTRPSSLDLPTPPSRGTARGEPKSCVEYSSSESDSDPEPKPVDDQPKKASSHVMVKLVSVAESDIPASKKKELVGALKVKDGSCLAVSCPGKDHGDYVLLRAPGQLAKLTSQDSGVSEPPQDNIQSSAASTAVAPADNACKSISAEGSPEAVISQGSVRHQVTSSPDSAMQQSFSSSSSGSDTVLGDRPSFRDDGYSSNSAVSFVDGHTKRNDSNESTGGVHKKPETGDAEGSLARANFSQCGSEPHQSDSKGRHPSRDMPTVAIGKIDGFNPLTNTEYEKCFVWTREGICQEMRETYQRRSSLGGTTSSGMSDAKMRGLVSEMKMLFERKMGSKQSTNSEGENAPCDRRYSLPSDKHQEGDYVSLDQCYQSLTQVMPDGGISGLNNNNISKELSTLSSLPNKPSRPKMGIHAKTRSLIASQRSQSLPRTIMSAYPSDPCLCKKSPSASSRSGEPPVQIPKLKRTSSDSCLAERAKSRLNVSHDVACYPASSAGMKAIHCTKEKITTGKKEKTRSLVSLPKINKALSKDKAQCIVGYVISEPAVPEYQFDLKIPQGDGRYLRSHSDPQRLYLRSQSDPNRAFLRSDSTPEKGVRVTGEGSEYGYKSGEDLTCSTSRPEVVGADYKLPNTEICSSEAADLAFHVKKYQQQPSPLQSHVNLNLSLWSSDSDGDSKSADMHLVPLTVISPPDTSTSPVDKVLPQSVVISPPEVSTSPDSLTTHCGLNLSKKRAPIMSYPPRTSNPEIDYVASYHTLPADVLHSKPVGDFKQLMENLAKKSEDVLKSKIFHSENCEEKNSADPSYDVILNIGFEDVSPRTAAHADGGRSQQITDITQEIENLTRTMDDLQKSMSSLELEETDEAAKPDIAPRSLKSTNQHSDANQGKTVQKYTGQTNVQKQSQYYQPKLNESSSSSDGDDDDDEYSLGGSRLGDSFVHKFRRRKKKSKLLSHK